MGINRERIDNQKLSLCERNNSSWKRKMRIVYEVDVYIYSR